VVTLTTSGFRDDANRLISSLGEATTLPSVNSALAAADSYSAVIKDLLYIRDEYHAHLCRKQNVIGTAMGDTSFARLNRGR
jgi:hypothetical protein